MPFRTFPVQANPAGGSFAVITTGAYQTWRVTQVSNNVPLASGLANLKKSGELITPMIARNGVAGGEPPVELYPSERMTVEWPIGGLVGSVRVQYEVM